MTSVEVKDDGLVVELILNSPQSRNAIDEEMTLAFRKAVSSIQAAKPSVVLLRARGSDFCVGGNLHAFNETQDSVADYIRRIGTSNNASICDLEELGVPVVAAVNGAAAGGGLGLALCADLIVASESARFRSAYTAIGLSPDLGVSYRLPRRLGESRALELMLTNRIIDASTALNWGLVNSVVPEAMLLESARELAHSIAAAEVNANLTTRKLVRDSEQHSLSDHLELELNKVVKFADSNEFQSRVDKLVNRGSLYR